MTKDARLDLRVKTELKAALQRIAERQRRRLTDLIEIVLTDYVAEEERSKRK
jgi:uncharacterized protein (DUF1778 family)